MALSKHRWALITGFMTLAFTAARSQVFVVGEKSATTDIATDFTPTELPLPTVQMTERGRRELVRDLEDEQGFAHRALPIAATLTLRANGPLSPGPAEYRRLIYQKGQSAAPGDRVIITAMQIKGDRIILDLNGGPYLKHRFLRHIELGDNPVVADTGERATGSRITLVFTGPVPEISAPEVKALLAPVVDFGVKTSEQAYADTLPPVLKEAIAAHDVLVGMTHRMVLAAMGAPESKIREQPSGDANGGRYEEWIYGHVPQTIHFVRFVGDRVTVVEIAALGKPIEIHDKDEMGGYTSPDAIREIAMGDQKPDGSENAHAAPPTLRKPGEAVPAGGSNKVQFPTDSQSSTSGPTSGSTTSPHLL
jgi:chloramphenicol 3-O-phosphotransferase